MKFHIPVVLFQEVAEVEASPSAESKKKQKVLTREEIAKKLVRKKIVVNTKLKFDEETGQVRGDFILWGWV